MAGIEPKNVDRGMLMVFALCYEYSLSFPNLYKLYKISERYFWTFMEICSPMLKMGVRKASLLRRSVDKLLPHITGVGKKEELTPREGNMLEMFRWFLEDNFSDGEGCISLDQLEQMPFAKGYTKKDFCIATTYKGIKNNLENIEYIDIGGCKFFKTTKLMFYMEKYCSNLDIYQINNLSIKEILRKIDEGERLLEEAEHEKLFCK